MTTQPKENPDSLPAPGPQLKAAREARGLKIQDVAVQLHLQCSTVEAVEKDAYDELPAPTYVRGYLRNYAKLLNLDGDRLIAAYDHTDLNEPKIELPARSASQISSSDRPVQIFTFVVSLALVLLLLAWWQSRNVQDEFNFDLWSSSPDDSSNGQAIIDSALPDSSETIVQPAGLDYPIRVIRHGDTRTQTDTTPIVQAASQPAVDAPAPLATLPVQQPSADASATETEIVTPPVDNAGTITTDPELVLDLRTEAWLEIRDARGVQLYMGLAPAGEQLRFTGAPPLDVVIGNATGVDARYRGEPIDLEPSTRSGVARLQIGG